MKQKTIQFQTNVTVSAIAQRDDRFLCIEEHSRNGVVVNLPGGHIESGESAEDAVIREVMEETRWHFQPTGFIGTYLWLDFQREQRNIRLVFCGDAIGEDQSAQLDKGIVAAHWRSRKDIASDTARLRAPVVLSAVDDYLNGRREHLDTSAPLNGLDQRHPLSSLAADL